ncbi:DEAD/DEAH box helicase [Phocea massiliensis]|uniref:DEAD/DEAH box helicase n=1 Tax=Merdimmobilis hominis TaxID=2897707 RepID=UPI000AA0C9BF|nr:DEAD/DEAH box helicase [Merdimmobilis hominis]MCD4836283.1 DEAD/DEAH box helicase [Merdimmobilis hominis]PWL62681.1 MAG: ATP-dependent helicase [Oscillospiraceae bacterium]
MTKYSELALSAEIQQAVEKMGFTQLTEVQEKAIPVLLEGKEVIAKAPTGTGKTCAFGIPIIEMLSPESKQEPQALILCPTRELCLQIRDVMRDLTAFLPHIRTVAVYGGQPIAGQIEALKKSPQIVVATPGRLLDHLKRKTIQLTGVTTAILDEADEMLDMGFFKEVRRILDALPKGKRLSMFSATISREVMDIGWLYQRDPVEITVQPVEDSRPQITQYSLQTNTGRQKIEDLCQIIARNGYHKVLVFCNTKYATSSLCDQLNIRRVPAICLSGELQQSARNKIMAQFREQKDCVLIATDVAARGIDVEDVDAVVNYDVPQSNEYYLHRIGRTGRAKKSGTAYIFYMEDEKKRLDNIIHFTRSDIQPMIREW